MNKEDVNTRTIEALNYILSINKRLTKAALASNLNIKPAKFSEILNFRMNAGVDIMSLLSSNYNISAEWLLTGEGNMIKNIKPGKCINQANTSDAISPLLSKICELSEEIGKLREQLNQTKEKDNARDVDSSLSADVG